MTAPLESGKTEFLGKLVVFSGQKDPLDCSKTIRSGDQKQLPGPSIKVLRLHFQGKFWPPPPPAAMSSDTPMA